MTGTSWGLVVATYNRADILESCVKLALAQTRPPSEIVIVDASDDWERTRDRIAAVVDGTAVILRYAPAREKSAAVQRNQGVELATADVVFMIDDDSLMHPDCAAEIMAVYDADLAGEVAGIQATLSDVVPNSADVSGPRKASGASETGPAGGSGGVARAKRWLWRHVFLMSMEESFVPYDGAFHRRAAPASVAGMNVTPTTLFHGCRMTFRRDVALQEPMEALLRSYCPGEDLDASYRASRHGALLTAGGARLHHFQNATGRVNRYQVSLLTVLNQTVMVRRHADDRSSRLRELRALTRRRLVAEFCKDALSRRWDFPQLRGVLAAQRQAPALLAMSDAELEQRYPEIQRKILAG